MKIRMLSAIAIAFMLSTYAAAQIGFLIGPKPEKKWMELLYRANGAAPGAKPALLVNNGTAVGFTFPVGADASMFTTKHPAYNGQLLGNLTNKSAVVANIQVSGTGFTYYGEGTPSNPCGTQASVRLYFETTNNELGYSQYWWSNNGATGSYVLAAGPATLTANLVPSEWSDWDGHMGNSDAAHIVAFNEAVADVQQIGLSFGGGCFFANGVGDPSGSANIALTNLVAQ